MPIVTHEDEIALAKIDGEVALALKSVSKKITELASEETKLANMYQSYSKLVREYAMRLRDKSKQMDTLAREERSGIEKKEVDAINKKVLNVDEQIKKIEGYYDRMKDLAVHKSGLTKRLDEYADLIVENAKIRKKIVELGLKIEKEKSKLVVADNLEKLENERKDIERDFERSKKELDKKWDQLVQERSEVNTMWISLKDATDGIE
jgi:uncharacterized protein YdiU (UPF0061 family)